MSRDFEIVTSPEQASNLVAFIRKVKLWCFGIGWVTGLMTGALFSWQAVR